MFVSVAMQLLGCLSECCYEVVRVFSGCFSECCCDVVRVFSGVCQSVAMRLLGCSRGVVRVLL